ncbi:putative cytochrome b5 reductase [Aspergillus clavatus NRRL 1]|uniref:Cytochrome b5 reductase, putative n=1 Tax=Aspergillus clavatus (strain ATCC 1007 / CBS 513.65 / DSM 816 / NCTC 3887 / NRRL 1 / QM 1276 / 107) TaxID=344612 RepID=A1CAW9_ASPCL|nr:cytochrome b5 reductase, putative [Aspergillus clavatus NRRL 1]EAW12887.1 cytochrome b5 reductase, putative [Aspergillus clavatus NRRL 1]
MPEFTVEDVALHKSRDDLWVIIHGKVYDLTQYLRDHPGGADVLIDVAGTDATAAYEDVGHSEDADEIMQTYLIGTVKDAQQFVRKAAVRVIQAVPPPVVATAAKSSSRTRAVVTTGSAAGLLSLLYCLRPRNGSLQPQNTIREAFARLPRGTHLLPAAITNLRLPHGGFVNGFAAAALISATIGTIAAVQLSKLTQIDSGFAKYPPHMKSRRLPKPDPHNIPGFLVPKDYKTLPLVQKDVLAPNVYRFVFQLPNATDIIGLPIGQHVAIKAIVNGQTVSRSYTPTSNNLDRGRLELVIKCYPDGLLTGQYLANLQVGEEVLFRGPKGAMKYKPNMCKRIGMIAGGTGITPMYQLIRAICEGDTDTTEISLVYANRGEEDILLRVELEAFARKYPKQFRVYYMLDNPPKGWKYGKGYVTPQIMEAYLPKSAADTKIMLCGPPGMVNAAKKGLGGLGFEMPGAVAKVGDRIFCF